MENFFNIRLVINDMVLYLIKNILNGQIVFIKSFRNRITNINKDTRFIVNKSYTKETVKTISPRILETELFNLNDWINDSDDIIKSVLSFLNTVGRLNPESTSKELRNIIYSNLNILNEKISSKKLKLKERQQIDENKRSMKRSVFFYNDFIDYIKDCESDIKLANDNIDFLLFNLKIFTDNFDNIKRVIKELKKNDSILNSDLKALEKMTVKLNLITKNNFMLINRNINRNISNIESLMKEYKEVMSE